MLNARITIENGYYVVRYFKDGSGICIRIPLR
jgi:hypothetical protein